MSANYPCSICDFVFGNPRELGTHILTAHCNDAAGGSGGSSTSNEEVDNKSNITLLTTTSKSTATTQTTPAQSYNQGGILYYIDHVSS